MKRYFIIAFAMIFSFVAGYYLNDSSKSCLVQNIELDSVLSLTHKNHDCNISNVTIIGANMGLELK